MLSDQLIDIAELSQHSNISPMIALCQENPSYEIGENETSTSCHYWTFFPPNKCYILDGCKESENQEAKSGERNCPPGKYSQEKRV